MRIRQRSSADEDPQIHDTGRCAPGDEGADWSDCTPGADAAEVDLGADENTEITIAAFNGWDESYAAAHLTEYALEEEGYSVSVESFDAGPGYTAVAQGDVDFLMDAANTIAVNEDSPAQSMADLAEMAEEYDSTIVGIEAGAGLTRMTEEDMIPAYGLDDWDFQVSSTPAMLAQLQSATDSGENVVVTLWRPHWAYDAFPIRDLEDPEGAMGDAEVVYDFARGGFADDNPEVTQLLRNLVISDDNLFSLENVMFSDEHYGGEDLEDAVAEWVGQNEDFIEDWKAGTLS